MSSVRHYQKDLDALPTWQTILDAIGNFFVDGCQVEEFLLAEAIFRLFGKLPIHRRLGSKVIIPIHAWHCVQDLSPMAQGDRDKVRPWASRHHQPNRSGTYLITICDRLCLLGVAT